ncbi:MAG: HAD-IA family hydrolase [Candidatus Diapherotrites archaeon]|nr:HAD-IA family hydrolase [Candidatus Diapherotrites archaeon]
MAIKAVIFDMDDTLLRTYKIAYGTYMLTAKALGLKKVPMKKFLKHWGMPYDELIRGTWRNAPIEEFSRIHGEFARKRSYPLIKGVNEMLAELKRRKMFLAIMSSKHTKAIPLRARQAGLKLDYFRELIGLESAPFHKPDGRVFRKLIAELKGRKIKKSETLYVGDGLMDYGAAKNAHLQFAAVLTGFRKRKDFLRAGLKDECILKSVIEVPKFIESQSN